MIRAAAIAAITGTVVLLSFTTPLIWAARPAVAGLAALAGMAIAGKNRILQMRKAEARCNPMEQRHSGKRLKEALAALEECQFIVERMESAWCIALAVDGSHALMDPHATGP